MLPLTIQAAQAIANLLTTSNALHTQIEVIAQSCGITLPTIPASQVMLSSASPDIGDKSIQLTYPRVCIYSGVVKNAHTEKFRSLSGTVYVTADLWASADTATATDQWIHFYVEALTEILRTNIGDWGNGLFFPGIYDVQINAPKVGGFGFVQSAAVQCSLNVSRN